MNLKGALFENLQTKLLSLLLAVLLWLFVTLETNAKITIPLSVQCVNTPSGLVTRADTGSGVAVRIEGPRILLWRQKFIGATARLDLSGAQEGSIVYSGIEKSVKLINGVSPVELMPQNVRIILEPLQ